MYLKYNNSSSAFPCTAENIENDIRIIFLKEFEACTEGFKLFSDSGKTLGDYTDFKTIKTSYADGFLFSMSADEEREETEQKSETFGEKLAKAEKRISELESQIKAMSEDVQRIPDTLEENQKNVDAAYEKIKKLAEFCAKISDEIKEEKSK